VTIRCRLPPRIRAVRAVCRRDCLAVLDQTSRTLPVEPSRFQVVMVCCRPQLEHRSVIGSPRKAVVPKRLPFCPRSDSQTAPIGSIKMQDADVCASSTRNLPSPAGPRGCVPKRSPLWPSNRTDPDPPVGANEGARVDAPCRGTRIGPFPGKPPPEVVPKRFRCHLRPASLRAPPRATEDARADDAAAGNHLEYRAVVCCPPRSGSAEEIPLPSRPTQPWDLPRCTVERAGVWPARPLLRKRCPDRWATNILVPKDCRAIFDQASL